MSDIRLPQRDQHIAGATIRAAKKSKMKLNNKFSAKLQKELRQGWLDLCGLAWLSPVFRNAWPGNTMLAGRIEEIGLAVQRDSSPRKCGIESYSNPRLCSPNNNVLPNIAVEHVC